MELSSSLDKFFEGVDKIKKMQERHEEEFIILKEMIRNHLKQKHEKESENENNQKPTKDVLRKRITMTKKRKIKRTCMKTRMWKTKMNLQNMLL